MRMRMVDYLIQRIYEAGAKHIFFVPGTGCMFLTDALARNKNVCAVSTHHEQAAGMAALTYAKYNNQLGACVVTTGCGGTNAITALLHAWQDNVPCIFVSGQAARHQTVRNSGLPLRQMGRQEADIISIVKPITKYAEMFNRPDDVVKIIDQAIFWACEGRKGPVWLDVPMDIQNSVIDPDLQSRWSAPADAKGPCISEKDMQDVLAEIEQSQRPVILAGNGIRLAGGVDDFLEFVHRFQIPVTYSRLGHDLMETDDPLSIGMVGMLGASRAGNFALANSDLILCIGCRLSIDTTGYEYDKFARQAKLIVIDIDPVEHSKGTVQIDRFIHAEAGDFLARMKQKTPPAPKKWWIEKCLHWKEAFPPCPEHRRTGEEIDMYFFTHELSRVLPDRCVVMSDAGNTFFTVSPVIRVRGGMRSITSGGEAEMGYALPGSLGAAYASGAVVICINGDGSVMMNLQELETIAYAKLPIKIFVMNNNGYSSIRHLQNGAFRGRQIGCDASTGVSFPSFERVAYAFGLPYVRIAGTESLAEKIDNVIKTEGPVLCEVMCVKEQTFLTVSQALNSKKRLVNRPLEDQAPFLERDVFLREMVIEPLDE